jgi:hypothetical protein
MDERNLRSWLFEKRTGKRLWNFAAYWLAVVAIVAVLETFRFTIGGNPPRSPESAVFGFLLFGGLAMGAGAWRVGRKAA